MKLIPLTQGKFAMVDDNDFESLNMSQWYAVKNNRNWYAARMVKSGGISAVLYMHKLLCPECDEVDHKNGCGIDNRKDNLRPATARMNQGNVAKRETKTTSIYKGVCWEMDRGKWGSRIGRNPAIFLGRFESEVDAARAYDEAAKRYFGEFARLNFPT